jgi:Holliday junction resolvase-like predicted endonuclease
LPESKNGSISQTSEAGDCRSHLKTGWQCEELALKIYQNHGYELLKRRWKTPFAEVDLFMKSPLGDWVILEVKSLPSAEYLFSRLAPKQKRRLQKAFIWATENWGAGEMHLVCVAAGEVFIFTEIFD